jgi:poly(A) polymerase
MKLEYVESLTLAHPFIQGFEQVLYCLTEDEFRGAAEGDVPEVLAKRKKESIEGKPGSKVIYTTTFYIGLGIEPKQRALNNLLKKTP